MDFIISLITHLADNLSVEQFVAVGLLIGVGGFVLARYLVSMSLGRGLMARVLPGRRSSDTTIDEILVRLDGVSTKEESKAATDAVLESIASMKEETLEQKQMLKMHAIEMLNLRHTVDRQCEDLSKDLDDIMNKIQEADKDNTTLLESMKELLLRYHDTVTRMNLQIERIDEFARSAIPEFRSSHKELSKDMSELNRDIALIERSIQAHMNSINTVSSINLR